MVPASPNLFAILYKSNTEGTNFRMLVCCAFMWCACFVLYSTCATFELVKSPEVTLCGWLGYKPTINNNNNNTNNNNNPCIEASDSTFRWTQFADQVVLGQDPLWERQLRDHSVQPLPLPAPLQVGLSVKLIIIISFEITTITITIIIIAVVVVIIIIIIIIIILLLLLLLLLLFYHYYFTIIIITILIYITITFIIMIIMILIF